VLGHEGFGSAAHLLKSQGLIESLSAGPGDEVRLGRGWLTYSITCNLTEEGEQQVNHVVATVYRWVTGGWRAQQGLQRNAGRV
jgi:insulysin